MLHEAFLIWLLSFSVVRKITAKELFLFVSQGVKERLRITVIVYAIFIDLVLFMH